MVFKIMHHPEGAGELFSGKDEVALHDRTDFIGVTEVQKMAVFPVIGLHKQGRS